jgi:hypothetical protein
MMGNKMFQAVVLEAYLVAVRQVKTLMMVMVRLVRPLVLAVVAHNFKEVAIPAVLV